MTDNNHHELLMSALKESDAAHAEKIRFDNDRLMFLNNELQRYGRPRCFALSDAEESLSKARAGGAA